MTDQNACSLSPWLAPPLSRSPDPNWGQSWLENLENRLVLASSAPEWTPPSWSGVEPASKQPRAPPPSLPHPQTLAPARLPLIAPMGGYWLDPTSV